MTQTTNFSLPTWAKDDPIRMTDFNAMTAALDTAIAGRCRVEIGSYVGNGVSGSNSDYSTLTFTKRPLALILPYGHGARMVLDVSTEQYFYPDGSWSAVGYQWNGNTLRWRANALGDAELVSDYQMNANGKTYYYLALYRG